MSERELMRELEEILEAVGERVAVELGVAQDRLFAVYGGGESRPPALPWIDAVAQLRDLIDRVIETASEDDARLFFVAFKKLYEKHDRRGGLWG